MTYRVSDGTVVGVNNGITIPTITSGTGVPSTSPPSGSLFLRTDGPDGYGLYSYDLGAWYPVGGNSGGGGGGISGVIVENQGTSLGTTFVTLNFTGSGVSTSNVSGVATVSIAGSTGGITTLTGDVSASGSGSVSSEVIGILSHALPALSSGYLEWTGSAWAFNTPGGGFTAGGDLSGSSSSQTVIGIDGVPLSITSLTTGNALQYNGSHWVNGAINLAGGAAYVTGNLPVGNLAFGTADQLLDTNHGGTASEWFTPGGDVTFASHNFTVAKIQGNPVSATAATAGQFLVENTSATGSAWTTLSGDVTNSVSTAGKMTVVALQGNAVESQSLGSSQDGYVLTWHNAGPYWYAAPSTGGGGSGITALTGDVTASGTGSVAATVTALRGNSVESQSLGSAQDGYVLTWYNAGPYWYAAPSTGSGGAELTTYLDLDFTTLANLAMPTDGTYTFAGLNWTRANSATDVKSAQGGFTLPAVGSTVSIPVTSSTGTNFNSSAYVYVTDGTNIAVMQLTATAANSVTAKNLGWAGYASPSTVFAAGGAGSITACAMIVNGAGLFFCPNESTNYYTSTWSTQLRLPMSQMNSAFSPTCPYRVWIYESADNSAQDYDVFKMSMDNVNATALSNGHNTGIAVGRGYDGSLIYGIETDINSSSNQPTTSAGLTYASNKVIVLHAPNGFIGQNYAYAGAWSSGLPPMDSLQAFGSACLVSPSSSGANTYSSYGSSGGFGFGTDLAIGMTALRGGASTNTFMVTIGYMRVEMSSVG